MLLLGIGSKVSWGKSTATVEVIAAERLDGLLIPYVVLSNGHRMWGREIESFLAS